MMDEGLERELRQAAGHHGHLCPGTVIGVRMALAGLRAIGITDPKGRQHKSLLAFVETDRCPLDAFQFVTGCRVSTRSLRFYDYGKLAATFVNLETGQAVRLVCPEETRRLVDQYCPPEMARGDEKARMVAAYQRMPEDQLFTTQIVRLTTPLEVLQAKVKAKIKCAACGEWVRDKKEVERHGRILCRACADGAYYTTVPATESAPTPR